MNPASRMRPVAKASTAAGIAARTPPDLERIRVRAYQIWEEQGRPEGRDHEHWQQAEHQLQVEFRIGFPDDLHMNTGELASPGDLDIDASHAASNARSSYGH